TAAERSWKGRVAALILVAPLACALHYFDYYRDSAPLVTFWPYGHENNYGLSPELVESLRSLGFAVVFLFLQIAFIGMWRGTLRELERNRPYRNSRLIATMLLT